MSGERLDYSHERQRHERFVGRAALLDRLDRLLVADGADRWVAVTGGPGMGKSALLSAWLARREAAGARVPHHFIRRGEYDWDDPAKLVGSLVAQLEERFPGQREPEADARMHPAARLAAMLARVSAGELAPRGERLVVLIVGLDEYDPPPGARPGDPLAAFLPHALPPGVSFLCASRPRHPYLSRIEARSGALVRIDLDAPELAAQNDATVREFWQREARSLGLGAMFIEEAVARAGGNFQHATMLRKYLGGLTTAQRRVKSIPGGLEALLDKLWDRIAAEPLAVHGLGILCAAREALTLEELGVAAGWAEEAQRRAFLWGARELLVETWRADQREYRLHHESIREFIARTLGDAVLRGHHAALASRIASWPVPADATTRRYALRHGLAHRAEAGDWEGSWRLAADASFLEAKCRELGAHEVEADVGLAAERCRASGDEALTRRFDDLLRVLRLAGRSCSIAPGELAAAVRNGLRELGFGADDLDEQPRLPIGATSPREHEGRAPVRRILHLSDLHFSSKEQATVWYAQLAADLRQQGAERLDALVVSGDLVERADPAEYDAARRFLEQLMAGFGLSPRQVALVPGNHDASWTLAKQAYRLHRREQHAGALVPGTYVEHGREVIEIRDEAAYRARLEPFAELYRAVKGAEYPLAFEDQGIVDDLADLGLCILGLNSAWETDHHFRDRAGIHPEALANALVRLGPAPAGQLRIAVFHHPIHGGEDSRIRDAAFLQQLAVHGFRLVLHGHVHKADAELYRHDRTEDGRRIELVAAGTFGASTREWVPGYPLQYNLLLVGPERITVETRCRREVNGAWEPDARWRQGPVKDPLPRYFIER